MIGQDFVHIIMHKLIFLNNCLFELFFYLVNLNHNWFRSLKTSLRLREKSDLGLNLRLSIRISAALILSLLPWKIDKPSEETKKLESRIIDNIRFLVKNSQIQNQSCESMTKFIMKNVWKAAKPLNLETVRSNKINIFYCIFMAIL